MYLNKFISILILLVFCSNMGGDVFAVYSGAGNKQHYSELSGASPDSLLIENHTQTSFNLEKLNHCHLGHCSHIIMHEFAVALFFLRDNKTYAFEFKYSDPFIGKMGPPPKVFS